MFSVISTTGEIPDGMPDAIVCAYALNDWGACSFADKVPENFGIGMVKVGTRLGIIATADNLMATAEKFIQS